MKQKQHERFQKLFYENLYLLKITDTNHETIFDVSGSTTNIYQVKIMKSFEWNHTFCNCPDSKKWANIHGVVCKHILFIVFKVLKLFKFKNSMSIITTDDKGTEFLEKRKLHKDFIEVMTVFLDIFNINNESNDFINLDYIEIFNKVKDKVDNINNGSENANDNTEILLETKDNSVEHCLICFEDFEKYTMLSRECNSQCLVCKTIFHIDCLTKWFTHNQSCPYCRSPSKLNTQINDNNEHKYINLFGI